jgi:adenylate cyclase
MLTRQSYLEKLFPEIAGQATTEAFAAALGIEDAALASRLVGELQRLSVLAEVADTVTQKLSLDHQLPRLIDLIAKALDAERATLFLHDKDAGELFSRVLRGEGVSEIRISANAGISGAVFTAGVAEIVPDAYNDPRFNSEIDRRTGYRTRSVLCAPLRNRDAQMIGVTQVLNKYTGEFETSDLRLVEAINRQAASALEQALLVERLEKEQREEDQLMAITEAISTELRIEALFARIMGAVTQLLDAERSTLFLYDSAKDELWSQIAEGADQQQIRIPAHTGIAGAAFTGGELLVIPDAYADARFNREVDQKSGYRTRNLVAVPIIDRVGERIGVVQVLNKRGGDFTQRDLRVLKAFCAQIVIAVQNAQLFSDVLYLKNYNESILKSLSNGVVTLDSQFTVVKINEAAELILGVSIDEVRDCPAEQVFGNRNPWVTRSLDYVSRMGTSDYHADTDLVLPSGNIAAINLTSTPLLGVDDRLLGYMLVLEDITREKRVRNTMARYVAKEVVDQLLANGDDFLQGSAQLATVMFSDIRRFMSIAESLTPRATVNLLNEYFTTMVDIVFSHGGMLDKYIGDAIMAVFGTPVVDAADAENAFAVSTEMMRELGAFNQRRAVSGEEPIDIGIGISTGEVLVGSLGSRRHLEYTVIGDNVNLAARLEAANKYYGTRVLLAGSTAEALRSRAGLRRLDLIQVKGRSQPTLVYESLAYHTSKSFPKLPTVIAAFEGGLDRYQRRDWDGALQRFDAALKLAPDDRPSRIFIDRCRYYRESPPPDNWNGVWIMEQK